VIRPAVPDDAHAVAALEREALGADAWSENLVTEGVAGRVPTTLYLVAERYGESGGVDLVGYAATSIVSDIAELQRIAVADGYRRRGVATQLLAAVQGEAKLRLAERILLEVREDNHPALGFYARAGFIELDRRPRYYADGTTAVVLARELGLEEES
jgi:ribosomal-protein-alanine N-acetyltransferase